MGYIQRVIFFKNVPFEIDNSSNRGNRFINLFYFTRISMLTKIKIIIINLDFKFFSTRWWLIVASHQYDLKFVLSQARKINELIIKTLKCSGTFCLGFNRNNNWSRDLGENPNYWNKSVSRARWNRLSKTLQYKEIRMKGEGNET